MFHKVCGNIMQGKVGFLISIKVQIYQGIFPWKKFLRSVKTWPNYGHESMAPLFGPSCSATKKLNKQK